MAQLISQPCVWVCGPGWIFPVMDVACLLNGSVNGHESPIRSQLPCKGWKTVLSHHSDDWTEEVCL